MREDLLFTETPISMELIRKLTTDPNGHPQIEYSIPIIDYTDSLIPPELAKLIDQDVMDTIRKMDRSMSSKIRFGR